MGPRVSITVGYLVMAIGVLAVLGSAAGARWILLVASLLFVLFGIRLVVGGRRARRTDQAADESPSA